MTNETAMSCSNQKPHFVLVPLFAPGHMIPLVDLGRLLASRGVLVSVVTTPRNTARLKAIVDRANASGLLIRLAELQFPCAEVGLPDGTENVDLVPSGELYPNFFAAISMLREPLLHRLREQWPKPSCIVSDSCNPWTMDVARELGVPRFVFHGPSCFFLVCTHYVSKLHHFSNDRSAVDAFEPFVLPDLPHKVEMVKAQSLQFFDYPGWEKFHSEVMEAERTADGLVVNTFDELEGPYIETHQRTLEKKVWTVGPVSLCNRDVDDKFSRGNKANVDETYISSWLDAKEPGSVIYVSFGSLARNSSSHLFEIGRGLKASNRPFIWVIKEKEMLPEVEEWLAEERVSSRGLILRGWAPQVLILSHPSVGGFMTHCGWNSTLEALTAGVPVITWPHFADQFLNEKLAVEVLGVGVALKARMNISYITEETEGLITREDVETAVWKLMDGGEEGEERRKRAKELGMKAEKAMEEGGSSHENLTHMIRYILDLTNKDSNAQEL